MAFGKKRFGDMLEGVRNKLTDSMTRDVKDLRNDEFKSQMNQERQKADRQQLWDKYKKEGERIDVPDFDAKIVDLPKEDVNEKEIKITPQSTPQGTSSYLPRQESNEWDLENLAGNGLSQQEPKEPTGISTYLDNRQDEENELENLAGNGIELPPEKEPSGISSILPKETDEEWDLEDNAGNGQREELNGNPFDETVAEEPSEEPAEEEPDVIPEPDEAEEEGNAVSDEEVEDTPAPKEEETKEVEDTKAPKEEGSTEEKKTAEQEEEKEEEPAKEKEKTTTKEGAINDDSDLVKRGSGVSVNDIVDRSTIPHYDYLSFFR